MKIFKSLSDWDNYHTQYIRKNNQSLGFVPTMGALHQGHISLCLESKKQCDLTIVSIYVNPTQFNNPEDLNNYPIDIDGDIKKLEQHKIDYVLLPTYKEIYNDHYKYTVTENTYSKLMEGCHRPGHFDGVLTIVMKLLNITKADKAFFGQKDFQQAKLITDMVRAFFMSCEIITCPTIRDQQGLALSSRNKHLDQNQLELSKKFNRILGQNKSTDKIALELEQQGFKVDYIEQHENRNFGAVYVGNTRLIDNIGLDSK